MNLKPKIDSNPYILSKQKKVHLSEFPTVLQELKEVCKTEGKEMLYEVRARLAEHQELLFSKGLHKVLIVLQGMDTSGKDGIIRHVFKDVSPLGIHAFSFSQPSEEELSHDYLWRCHQKTPSKGQIVIFNRSYYEDVLAVRVRKLVPKEVWSKRFEHINAFEKMLSDEGTLILKFFLHISSEEQSERLRARAENPKKQWKLQESDLKDRELWGDFQAAYEDVLGQTSTVHSPWHVIPADKKWGRNLFVAEILDRRLRELVHS